MIAKLQIRLKNLGELANALPTSLESVSNPVTWDRLTEDPSLGDRAAVKQCFDREEAGQKYKQAVDSKQEYGLRNAAAAKMQSDLLSSMQQGFVMRHRTRMQMLADAASFRKSVNEARVTLIMERQIANVESAQ